MNIDVTAARSRVVRIANQEGWLVVTRSSTPGTLGRRYRLTAAEAVLGRGPEAEVQLEDDGISRRHARIVRAADGGFELHDLASTNGTYHNGLRLQGSIRLEPGDKLQLGGQCRLKFSWDPSEDADEELREALAAAQVGTFTLQLEGTRVTWSESVERLVGAAPGGLSTSALPLRDFVHPEDWLGVTGALERAVSGQRQLQTEFRFRQPGPSEVWVALRGDVLRGVDGTAGRVVGTLLDITARKSGEDELRRQALMFESLTDAVVLVGLDGLVLDWNASAERFFGFTKPEALGREYRELLRFEDPEVTPGAIHTALKRYGRWSRELTALRKDGARVFLETTIVPLRGRDGGHLASLAVHRDIGERRALQAQLLAASRMASVGTLASGVAHEINNPLAFISANLVWLRDQLEARRAALGEPGFSELSAVVTEARTGIERIESIVRDLKAFSRVEAEDAARPVDVRQALGLALKMAEKELRQRARLVTELEDVPPVLGSDGRLGQVFLTLLLNATQATPDGAVSSNEVTVRCVRRDRAVVVEVSDSGPGIPQESLGRVFDPFFTPRHGGERMGLGLAVAHRIVRGLGGDLTVRSPGGKGSIFTVSLPSHGTPTGPVTVVARDDSGKAGIRVLVVDDEPFICSSIQRLLRRDHAVTTVTSAREALGLVHAGQRFDVILSDLMMPEMSGEELLASLREVDPEQARRVVIMTGGAFTSRSEEFLNSLERPHLTKPLTLEGLRSAIQKALKAPSAAA